MTEFVPIAIRDIMKVEIALADLLGSGDDMRVYPVEAEQGAAFPFVVYHQMEEQTISTKDAVIPDGWEMMLTVHAENPGGYMTASRIARITKRVINGQTSPVLDDDGNTINVKLRFTGQEDLTPEEDKNITSIALTFRATKTN